MYLLLGRCLNFDEFWKLKTAKDEQAYFRQRANSIGVLNRKITRPKSKIFDNYKCKISTLTASESELKTDFYNAFYTAFTTVFDVEGMLVFGVFTSETTLSKWTDRETAFMAMPARAVLDLAETHSFGRIVIDSDQETMFVLERNRENISTTTVQEETQVQVGFPQHPIDGANKSQLLAAFSKNNNIKEVYHFVMLRNQESIYILAFVLENYSENARLAVMDCVSDGMKGFALDLPLESMYIEESDSWYETVQNFGVFYGGRSEK